NRITGPISMAADLTIPLRFKRRVEAVMPGKILKVMLFGSRARGDATSDSDWDLAVFLDHEPDWRDRDTLSDAAYDIMLEHQGAPIQAIALSIAALDDDTLLARNIRRDGVNL